jgi:dephospho-CoA kinase
MLVVGLTGGVASGKSLVSQVWNKEGAYIIDADQIAKELVKPNLPAWKEIVDKFGIEILNEEGSINRKLLASIIFSNQEKRELLNRILHPRIKEEIQRRIKDISFKDPRAIVVIDAPLLIEVGDYREMDRVVLVTSSQEHQMERLQLRDGLKKEEAQRIIDAQKPLSEKLKLADFIISNEGSIEEVKRKAKEVFKELKVIASQKENKNSGG